jgi:AcrR family transcriptional regulator
MTDKESRKKEITKKRRGQILKAAMEVFSRKGYYAATIPEIAKGAGIAAGTIYIYYPSKRELFISVIKDFIITAPLLKIIDKIPKADIAVTFKHILQNRFDLIKSEMVSRIPSLMAEVQRDPELKVLWAEQFLQPFMGWMEVGYRDMMVSGKFRCLEPAVAVRAIGGMIIGFLMLSIMEGESSPLNRLSQAKVADDMVNLLLHGLLKDAEEKKPQKDGAV